MSAPAATQLAVSASRPWSGHAHLRQESRGVTHAHYAHAARRAGAGRRGQAGRREPLHQVVHRHVGGGGR